MTYDQIIHSESRDYLILWEGAGEANVHPLVSLEVPDVIDSGDAALTPIMIATAQCRIAVVIRDPLNLRVLAQALNLAADKIEQGALDQASAAIAKAGSAS